METPDVLAFYVDDAPIIWGNTITLGAPDSHAYDTWFSMVNPLTGNAEAASVYDPTKTTVRFADRPIPSYVNKVDLHTLGNYSINGVSITAIYYRDQPIASGENRAVGGAQTFLSQFRHTVYLKLSAPLTNGIVYTVSNSANPFPAFSFTYNDKRMRAGGIKISQVGVRADDTFKKVYLCSRLPAGPNNGVVDFSGTYGITQAQIIDANTLATVATVNLVSRRAWNQLEANDGYQSTGIDVADTAVGYPVTGITQANPARVTCVGHPFVTNDKVRFRGIAGMTQIEAVGPGGPSVNEYIAFTVTADDADHFFINRNTTSGFSAFSSTPIYDTSLGGFSNLVYKCFNTNRAATSVWDLDLSTFTTPGNYYVYIPGYGISDPFYVGTNAYAIAASYLHNGLYNLRLGCDVNRSGYSRPAASVDGQNGCAIYQSRMVACFGSEGATTFTPTGATIVAAGLGGYSDEGAFTLSAQTWSGGLITYTTSTPLGMANGTTFAFNVLGSLPSGYNAGASGLAIGTVTGSNTFTFTAVNPGASTQLGIVRTGFVTSTRLNGYRAGTQDAGDNDEPLTDHAPWWQELAFTLNNIPAASRFTPFTVQLSTQVLDPTTYAGTDSLPPLVQEVFWKADNFRLFQDANGQVPGGVGLGHFSSQVPNYPETIQLYRGTDAGGSLTGQTVMNFVYASDHLGTMMYAALAAQIALLCQGYSLSSLATLWFNSSVAAYNRAHDLMTDLTIRDAYYVTDLNLPAKMGWTTAQYNQAMGAITQSAELHQYNAAAALYRYLGSASGQVPYGNVIDKFSYSAAPSVTSGGSGYAVGDLIVAQTGGSNGTGTPAIFRVLTISGSAVASVALYFNGEYTVAPSGGALAQDNAKSQTSGTGATFATSGAIVSYAIVSSSTINTACIDYAQTSGRNATAATYLLTHINGTGNATTYTSTQTCFNNMILPNNTAGSNFANQPILMVVSHMAAVIGSSIPAQRSSTLLQSLQGHIQWIMGANQPGKSMACRLGVRAVQSVLHEDSFKMGVAPPPGFLPQGYQSWASGGIQAFQGTGSNTDGPLTFVAANATGSHQSDAQPGATKMWNTWRQAEGYWEYDLECRGSVFQSETTQADALRLLMSALYCHGWDGNVYV